MTTPSAILFVNNDLTPSTQNMLVRQLYITEVLTGDQFDQHVMNDSTYISNIYLSNKRILVIRTFEDQTNRDLADLAIFIKNGLATVEDKKVGPHTITYPIVNLTWGKLGIFVKPTTAIVSVSSC